MNGQFTALVRHFFGRFFDNELVSQNSDIQVTVTKMLAMLASPGIILPFLRYTTYLGLDGQPPEMRLPMLWSDRTLYLSFSMLVMGAVTVLEWDALFPDRRDFATLIPLPIPSRTIFFGKIGALAVFLIAFTASVNLVSTIIFPPISVRGTWQKLVLTISAHGISVLASSAFAFLFLVALEGVLMNVLSIRWFRKTSAYVQGAMVVVLLWLFFLFPNIAASMAQLKEQNAAILYRFPPAWFLGLNEVLTGSHDAVFMALTRRALIGLCAVMITAFAAYAIAYHRHVRRTLESTEGSKGTRTAMHDRLGIVADRLLHHPVERGTAAFIGKTMARSPKHRIFLAAYVGVGCAVALQILSGAKLRDVWLSVPLALSFFILSGMRFIFTIPTDLPANWLFRLTETDQQKHALDGVRSAMRWFGVVPLFALLAPFYFFLWTPGVALAHFAFSITISLLMVEALTLEFWKIPFTCSYPPGKANVTFMGVFYVVAFLAYAYGMARLEQWMVLRPRRLIFFYLCAGALWAMFESYRRRSRSAGAMLIFDDAFDPAVRTLNLSEIAWLETASTAEIKPSAIRRSSSSRVSRAE